MPVRSDSAHIRASAAAARRTLRSGSDAHAASAPGRLWICGLVAILTLASFPSTGRAQIQPASGIVPSGEPGSVEIPRAERVDQGSSSRWTRRKAVKELPLESLSAETRREADAILGSLGLFRRLSAYQFEVDPRVHDYFTEHPDMAVSIWRAMGISTLQMTQVGPEEYRVQTEDGTVGTLAALKRGRESNLILCRGMLKSPYLARPIEARALMHLHSTFSEDAQGRSLVTYQADLFVSFPSQGVETVAKLVSPVSNIILDRNFEEISLFVHVMWLAMNRQPGWVEQLTARTEGVARGQREELLKLTAEVYVDGQAHRLRQAGRPVSIEALRPPVRE